MYSQSLAQLLSRDSLPDFADLIWVSEKLWESMRGIYEVLGGVDHGLKPQKVEGTQGANLEGVEKCDWPGNRSGHPVQTALHSFDEVTGKDGDFIFLYCITRKVPCDTWSETVRVFLSFCKQEVYDTSVN